ncbi:MAG: hypothetical protein ACYTDX_00820 [Planctomycetota bacterium]
MNRIGRILGGAALLAVVAAPSAADARTSSTHATNSRSVVRVMRRAPRTCSWVPARRVIRERAVVVRAGFWKETVHPERTRYVLDLDRCRFVRVVVSPRRVERTWVPAVVEMRREAVTVPGYWKCNGHRHSHAVHHRPAVRLHRRVGHH